MKFKLSLSTLSSLVFLSIAPQLAHAVTEFKEYEPRMLQIDASATMFNSNKNYDSEGKSKDLSFGNTYSLIQMPFGARYVFGNSFAARGGAETSYAESKNSDPIYRGTRTNSTLDEISAGLDYRLVDTDMWEIIADVDLRYGLIAIETGHDDVPTHEGIMTLTPGVQLQKSFDNLQFLARGGYMYRASGRSQLFPWAAQGVIILGGFGVGGEISGAQSMGNDADKGSTKEPTRLAVINRANAGSFRFYSMNPSYVEAAALVRYRGDNFRITGFGGLTLAGSNYADGTTFGVNFAWFTDFSSGRKSQHYSEPTTPSEKFVPKTDDGIDQKYFQDKTPPVPVTPIKPLTPKQRRQLKLQEKEQQRLHDQKYSQPGADVPATTKPRPVKPSTRKVQPLPPPPPTTQKAQPTKFRSKPADSSVQQQLNEAEMVIQLRRANKKKK